MISLSTIKIFDKIYQLKYEKNVNSSDFINNNFDNNVKNYIEFVKDNLSLFSNNNLLITQTLGGYGIVSGSYPLLNDIGLNKYYEYKKKQFSSDDEITLNYDFSNIAQKMNIQNTKALKDLLDYFIDSGLIVLKGEYAETNIIGGIEFDFSKLKVNKISEKPNVTSNTTIIEKQIIIKGDKQKISKNDFSDNKTEVERKKWYEIIFDKISGIFKK